MIFPIIVDEPITWKKIEVPVEIVRECKEYTNKDPYNRANDDYIKLVLLDCYWHKMGYYNSNERLNLIRLPVYQYETRTNQSRKDRRDSFHF